MDRKSRKKLLENTKLASGYGGWIYCAHCNQNIGYLCYVTYDNFNFTYSCKYGSQGSICIVFDDVKDSCSSTHKLITLKNRLCCPVDQFPLLTILEWYRFIKTIFSHLKYLYLVLSPFSLV